MHDELRGIVAGAQRNLFHLMGWLDAQLFRRAAAMRYGGASEAEPYTDPGKDHWRRVVVSSIPTPPQSLHPHLAFVNSVRDWKWCTSRDRL